MWQSRLLHPSAAHQARLRCMAGKRPQKQPPALPPLYPAPAPPLSASFPARAHHRVQAARRLARAHKDDGLTQLLALGEDHVLEHTHLVAGGGAVLRAG